jgi:hypothetical protein
MPPLWSMKIKLLRFRLLRLRLMDGFQDHSRARATATVTLRNGEEVGPIQPGPTKSIKSMNRVGAIHDAASGSEFVGYSVLRNSSAGRWRAATTDPCDQTGTLVGDATLSA